MTRHQFMVIMIFINAALMLFNAFYTHDTVAMIINLFGCVASWAAIHLLDWVENKRLEFKDKLGEDYDDNE